MFIPNEQQRGLEVILLKDINKLRMSVINKGKILNHNSRNYVQVSSLSSPGAPTMNQALPKYPLIITCKTLQNKAPSYWLQCSTKTNSAYSLPHRSGLWVSDKFLPHMAVGMCFGLEYFCLLVIHFLLSEELKVGIVDC